MHRPAQAEDDRPCRHQRARYHNDCELYSQLAAEAAAVAAAAAVETAAGKGSQNTDYT